MEFTPIGYMASASQGYKTDKSAKKTVPAELHSGMLIKPELTTEDYRRYLRNVVMMPTTREQKLKNSVLNSIERNTLPRLLEKHNINEYGQKALTVIADSGDINTLTDIVAIADKLNKYKDDGGEVDINYLNKVISETKTSDVFTANSKLRNLIIDCWNGGDELFTELCGSLEREDAEEFEMLRAGRKDVMLKAWEEMQAD